MNIEERMYQFADTYGFIIENENIIKKLAIDETKEGIIGCPCVFKPLGEERLFVIMSKRCPCDELLTMKSGESCTCGLFKKA